MQQKNNKAGTILIPLIVFFISFWLRSYAFKTFFFRSYVTALITPRVRAYHVFMKTFVVHHAHSKRKGFVSTIGV